MLAKVVFQVTAGLYMQFLNFLAENDINLSEIKYTSLGFTAVCYGEDYFFIAKNSKKFQSKVRIIKKKGLYFNLRPLKKRKGLAAAAVLFFIFTYIFSNIIWIIDIDTDQQQLKNLLAKQLFEENIFAGSIYSEEKLADAIENIMLKNEQLGYMTLNFYKGILQCNIYERTNREEYINNLGMNNIYSQKNGVITDIRVYDGYSQVTPGQSVTAGDLLVSNIYTDKHGNIYTGKTRAYIEAACDETYSVFIPFSKNAQLLTGEKAEDVSVYIANFEFKIKSADISSWQNSMKFEKMEYYSFLGFHLPLTVKNTVYYRTEEKTVEKDILTALNYGKTQLKHMISNDEKLKKEKEREFHYTIQPDGLTVICNLSGIYEIT